jgi:hypothetical protein
MRAAGGQSSRPQRHGVDVVKIREKARGPESNCVTDDGQTDPGVDHSSTEVSRLREMKAQGLGAIAKALGIGRASLYRLR